MLDKVVTEEDLENINKEIDAEIAEAIQKAEAAPLPNPERIYEGLFA